MIYSSNDNAKEILLTDSTRLNQINSGIRGYFPKAVIHSLLSDSSTVGVRFYNVAKNVRMLIASAAKADGSEDNTRYFLSQGTNPAIEMDRSEATDQANPYNGASFMSFFSRQVLLGLIANVHSGVCLYETTFEVISSSDLDPQNQQNLINIASAPPPNNNFQRIKTHLLAPITLDAMGNIPMLTSTSMNRVSLHPCPGHCVKNGSVDTVPPDSGNNANDPYLFDWTSVSI